MVDTTSLFNRTLNDLKRHLGSVVDSVRGDQISVAPDLPEQDRQRLHDLIAQCIRALGGEVASRAVAIRIGQCYLTLNRVGKERFLRLLATDFDVDDQRIQLAIDAYRNKLDTSPNHKLRHNLQHVLKPTRLHLLTQFNSLQDGIKFLVDMRADLLDMGSRTDAELREVESDLKYLLAAWFDIGLLRLEAITWQSPAALLEKLIVYEAVHAITSWSDLKGRLDVDRRLFTFFHPNMPGDPLIFVEVALVNGLATSVQTLLDLDQHLPNVETANTAIFYSISNTQKGLTGISFGNFLIKRVVQTLKQEMPHLKQFATLSPVPGFRRWLKAQLTNNTPLLTANEYLQLRTLPDKPTLLALLDTDWAPQAHIAAVLQPILTRLCAVYLTSIQADKLRLLDGVAHFHSSNGATLQQINWLGDTSANGMEQSAGIMVNYVYDLTNIDHNSEQYSRRGVPSLSPAIHELAAIGKTK